MAHWRGTSERLGKDLIRQITGFQVCITPIADLIALLINIFV